MRFKKSIYPRKYLGDFLHFILFVFVFFLGYRYYKTAVDTDISRIVHIRKSEGRFQLYKNGEPYEVKGASGPSFFKELAQIGGNTIRVYDTVNLKSILDSANMYHLSVIVDIPITRYYKENDLYKDDSHNENLKVKVKHLVEKYKKHPALLFWNLGNEVRYPLLFRKNKFINTFNDLIDIIHKEDPDHPVSTAITSASRKELISIYLHSPKIDIIAVNVFGRLRLLKSLMRRMSLLFSRNIPYYVSEWGGNGPWEEERNSWYSPIEPTSTKKAEQFRERYLMYIESDPFCMGSLAFYWGNKHERTHTWFSIFDEEGRKSQVFYELQSLWNDHKTNTTPKTMPLIKYMLVDDRGSRDPLIFNTKETISSELLFEHPVNNDQTLEFKWEIYPEVWYYKDGDYEKKPALVSDSIAGINKNKINFITPEEEGPYRIFVYVYDQKGNYATANTPFYVVASTNGK